MVKTGLTAACQRNCFKSGNIAKFGTLLKTNSDMPTFAGDRLASCPLLPKCKIMHGQATVQIKSDMPTLNDKNANVFVQYYISLNSYM
jgi:hypothetical protein